MPGFFDSFVSILAKEKTLFRIFTGLARQKTSEQAATTI